MLQVASNTKSNFFIVVVFYCFNMTAGTLHVHCTFMIVIVVFLISRILLRW
jgi:hypothetical protein